MEIIVCALKYEMNPLKQHFKNNVKFINCGIKAKNLDFLKNIKPNDHIINIGICAGDRIGNLYLCNKIIDQTNIYYPDLLINSNIKQRAITTIDFIADEKFIQKNSNMLFDQESAIIYKEAIKYIQTHQISFLKIVSDLGITDYSKLKYNIDQLIASNFDEINNFVNLSKIFFNNIHINNLDNLINKYSTLLQCNTNMKLQLNNLFTYANALNVDINDYLNVKINDYNKINKTESLKIISDLRSYLIKQSY